jgi:leucyl/phenylalanyl-tRNA--protein transferase
MVYLLSEDLAFPPAELANDDGVVAVGGDVSPSRLVLAYQSGIFPWPVDGLPLLWFSPDPRFVLEPARAHLSKSLRRAMKRAPYRITADTAFTEVIDFCAHTSRPGQSGTWITPELRDGYVRLHQLGIAHSIEAWEDDKLVGGLYGVSLGGGFFGESMFARAPDASKIAFGTLCAQLTKWGFPLIDCQVRTQHLARFGAEDWSRTKFLERLGPVLEMPSRRGEWQLDVDSVQATAIL